MTGPDAADGDRPGCPGDPGGRWADRPDRPGLFFQIRDGRPRLGIGCAVFAIAGSIAAVVLLVLALQLIASALSDVPVR